MARFEEFKDIFVFVEQENGNIAEVSYELISEARKLVASIPEFGYKVVGVLLGENVKEKASYITPVPGGVGPMTIAMLMNNVIKAAEEQTKKKSNL